MHPASTTFLMSHFQMAQPLPYPLPLARLPRPKVPIAPSRKAMSTIFLLPMVTRTIAQPSPLPTRGRASSRLLPSPSYPVIHPARPLTPFPNLRRTILLFARRNVPTLTIATHPLETFNAQALCCMPTRDPISGAPSSGAIISKRTGAFRTSSATF